MRKKTVKMEETKTKKVSFVNEIVLIVILAVLAILFVTPIFIVLINSFKSKIYISDNPFSIPNSITFIGFENYKSGISKTDFFQAFGYSSFITIFSVLLIVLFTSMTAWYIIRIKSKFTSLLYYLFVFAMIVPFQMVMFTMVKTANVIHLDNPVGIVIIYLGFGAGLSVFMFSGFVKSIPLEIEEAAMIDGCNPLKSFFRIVLPMLKPTAVTVAILNTMWIWNDYLLPYLILGTEYKTIPIAIQYLRGGFGSIDMGAMMAVLILDIIPIVIFYLLCQKHIIRGVAEGAVKG